MAPLPENGEQGDEAEMRLEIEMVPVRPLFEEKVVDEGDPHIYSTAAGMSISRTSPCPTALSSTRARSPRSASGSRVWPSSST